MRPYRMIDTSQVRRVPGQHGLYPQEAVRLGVAAASLSVSGLGGTGHVAPLEETRAHAADGVAKVSA